MMREEMSDSGEKASYFGEKSCLLGEKRCLLARKVECGGQNVLRYAGRKAYFVGESVLF